MPILSHTERIIFSGDNIATPAFVYNSNASTGSEDGWHNAKSDEVVVQIGCATLTSVNIAYRVEGRLANSNRTASLNYGVISSTNIDRFIRIEEKVKEIRVGAKLVNYVSSPLASPHNIYCSIGFTDFKR